MNLIEKIFTTSFLYKWAFILTLNYKIDFCEKYLELIKLKSLNKEKTLRQRLLTLYSRSEKNMKSDNRISGIGVIGNVPWGTHFCIFYQTKEDSVDITCPLFESWIGQ